MLSPQDSLLIGKDLYLEDIGFIFVCLFVNKDISNHLDVICLVYLSNIEQICKLYLVFHNN